MEWRKRPPVSISDPPANYAVFQAYKGYVVHARTKSIDSSTGNCYSVFELWLMLVYYHRKSSKYKCITRNWYCSVVSQDQLSDFAKTMNILSPDTDKFSKGRLENKLYLAAIANDFCEYIKENNLYLKIRFNFTLSRQCQIEGITRINHYELLNRKEMDKAYDNGELLWKLPIHMRNRTEYQFLRYGHLRPIVDYVLPEKLEEYLDVGIDETAMNELIEKEKSKKSEIIELDDEELNERENQNNEQRT